MKPSKETSETRKRKRGSATEFEEDDGEDSNREHSAKAARVSDYKKKIDQKILGLESQDETGGLLDNSETADEVLERLGLVATGRSLTDITLGQLHERNAVSRFLHSCSLD